LQGHFGPTKGTPHLTQPAKETLENAGISSSIYCNDWQSEITVHSRKKNIHKP